jgi:hypothetical protein
MRTLTRRLRGILGIGLVWSVVWALTGFLYGATTQYWIGRSHRELDNLSTLISMALASAVSWASYGFVLGCIFGGVLSIAERRRTLDNIATWRIAVWGGTAGLLLPLGFMLGLMILKGWTVDNAAAATAISVALGAGCAAASLNVARAGLADARSVAAIPDEPSSQRPQG